MSIKVQAEFWLRNVNDYKETKEFSSLNEGFIEFSCLLKNIFEDFHSYEISKAESKPTKIGINADDLGNYHNLTETIDCLYIMCLIGILDNKKSCLEIKKDTFKKELKGSPSFPMQMLENYGFAYQFYKNDKQTDSYKNCDKFYLFYYDVNNLIPAMKNFVTTLPETTAKEDYAVAKNIFYMADFESTLFKKSAKQTDINPMKLSILNMAGKKSELWHRIVERFENVMDFKAYINPYVFPNWTAKYLNKKKTIINFTITPDSVNVGLPLTFEIAKKLILARKKYPSIINRSIDGFGCIGCKKCNNQSNIENIEGVKLCKLSTTNFLLESPKMIKGNIESLKEAEVICDITMEMIK